MARPGRRVCGMARPQVSWKLFSGGVPFFWTKLIAEAGVQQSPFRTAR
jgi:hypothetical protein